MNLLKQILKFLEYIIFIVAIIALVYKVTDSGFILNSIKIECRNIKIEVSGHEKNTQAFTY